MNITIIGCGYVGTALANFWHHQQGHQVTATTTTQERVAKLKEVASQVVVMKGDDPQGMQSALIDQDTIVLSIAPISNRQVDANFYEATYIPTASNLVTALADNPNVKQVIYLSSCAVYGNQEGAWVDENSPIVPANEHGRVLSLTEHILLGASSDDRNVCILRLGGIYGPGRELSKRFERLAGTTLPGSGDNFINWIHRDDIVQAVEFARQNRSQGIYNLVNDIKLTTREVTDKICDRYNLPKVLWDSSQPNFRTNNARVHNQKLKVAGYELIHAETLI
ncbi:SDR family oxidoreductase [Moorena bouillonii]|uniref:NAD(P)-dependent oxidoreductase n=1 Tax=Moorena bouillonii PNG TaxID=568701 RepID=A0A1U7N5J4_9CYAN|nr:SDR family oxidoreductase [Moorena bouillonii]OLT61218.1 NAD(P)-dependent oxidoreductase [Moorena bouillonii PNG]